MVQRYAVIGLIHHWIHEFAQYFSVATTTISLPAPTFGVLLSQRDGFSLPALTSGYFPAARERTVRMDPC
jgi:hypothetical protein